MLIFNHPSFAKKFWVFPLQFGLFLPRVDARRDGPHVRFSAHFARNRRFIKPNKAESPNDANSQIFIGSPRCARSSIATENCRASCNRATIKETEKWPQKRANPKHIFEEIDMLYIATFVIGGLVGAAMVLVLAAAMSAINDPHDPENDSEYV